MKHSIKIILLTLLIMCISAVCVSAYSDDTAYRHLVNMNLMQYKGETFEKDDVFTRAELAIVISGIYGEITDFTKYFNDVNNKTFGAVEISACAKLEIMVGDGDKNFRPDEPVSAAELAKVLTDMLGYKPRAEINGGYPYGYFAVASGLGLYENIDSNTESLLCREAAEMIFRALKSKVLVQTGYGEKNTWTESEETLMRRMMKLDYIKGIVDATPLAQLKFNIEKRYISINGFSCEPSGDEDYFLLGHKVEAVYTADEDKNTKAISVISIDDSNIMSLYPKDIESVGENEITYIKGNALTGRKLKISPDASWFLNYEPVLTYDMNDFVKLDSGKLTLIDTDNNGTYENILVFAYDVYVFDKVSSDVIVDISGRNKLDLKSNTIEKTIVRNADGKIINLDSIKQYNVISVVTHNEICEINVCESAVSGYPSVSQNNIIVDGKEYKISDFLMRIMPADISGNMATVYLDISGTAFYMDLIADLSDQFGYLVNLKKNTGISESINAKIYTSNGKFTTLSFAEKVILNGNSVSDIIYALSENGSVKHQLIKYTLDKDGKIKSVYTAAEELASMENGFYKSYSNPNNTLLEYMGGIKSFGGIVYLDDATKIIHIPDDITDEEHFELLTHKQLMTDNYNVEAYNNSKATAIAEYIIIKGDIPYVTYDSRMAVVLKLIKSIDTGEVVDAIEYYQAGSVVTGIVDKDVDISGITEGSVCRLGLDSSNKIMEIISYYDVKQNLYTGTANPTGVYQNSDRIAFGTVADIIGDIMRFTTLDESRIPDTSSVNRFEGYKLSGFYDIAIVNYNGTGITATKGRVEDVSRFDKVIVQTRSGTPNVMFIIRRT